MERCGSVPEGHLTIAQQLTAGDEASPQSESRRDG
jgi:hypothetical protein